MFVSFLKHYLLPNLHLLNDQKVKSDNRRQMATIAKCPWKDKKNQAFILYK